jgi:hypothetical protein
MNYFIETALSPAKLFKMAGDLKSFKSWLLKTHNQAYDENMLKGHRFFLECAFTSIFHNFIDSESVALKNDPILEEAAGAVKVTIDKMPGKSDRQLILKNLFREYLDLTAADTEQNLGKSINTIEEKIVTPLINFYDTNFKVRKNVNIERSMLDKIILMDDLLIHFIQINNSGPYAHQGTFLPDFWIPIEKLKDSLFGYKYVIQYLYELILPSDIFLKTQMNEIHNADSWRKYVYNETENEKDDMISRMFRTYDLEKQTCFESYFYRLNKVLETDIPARYGISHMGPEGNLIPIKKKLPRSIVEKLIDSSVKRFDVEMTAQEQHDYDLHWHPVDVSNVLNVNEFNGVAAFNTLLIGTLAVTKDAKVYVNKWKHPTQNPKHNDYSYAVLLNTEETSNRSMEGWMLFFDCCNDFTGSRSDFLCIEKILKDNKRRIELVTRTITQEDFNIYLKNYMPDKDRLIHNEILGIKDLTKIKENKELFLKYQKARGVLLELLCYYAVSKHNHYENYMVKKWGEKAEGKEIDVLLESKTQVRLIECKYNGEGRDWDLQKRINEMNEVVRKRIEIKRNEKRGLEIVHHKIDGAIEFWFWHPPSAKNIELLENANIKYEVFESNQNRSEYGGLIKYKKMKDIFKLNFDPEDDTTIEI